MKPSMQKKMLSKKDTKKARKLYSELFEKAMPHSGGIDAGRIEVAHFNLSDNLEDFKRVGLGLETVVIFRDADGAGHTGKVLMNLPGQLLLEHGHVDTFVLRKGAPVPKGFVELKSLINGFKGIYQYNSDASVVIKDGQPQYLFRDGDYVIVQAQDGESPLPKNAEENLIVVLPGKSETFKAIHGDGVLLADRARVVFAPKGVNPDKPPKHFRKMIDKARKTQAITTTRVIYMGPGTNVLLPKCTKHAFLAGKKGAVYLEFSTPSMDEADRFTDPRVIR